MQLTLREPGSAITHFIALLGAIVFAIPLLLKAALRGGPAALPAMSIFVGGMIALYGASTLYHSVTVRQRALRIFRKIDHMMIFVLIAGSYTPVCVIVLRDSSGPVLLPVIWGIAAAGICLKSISVSFPKWISSVLYISMGWICLFTVRPLLASLSGPALGWLLAGGIIYTLGGILYALKLRIFNSRHPHFGSHEIFHLFVMGGSICHFVFMYFYVI